MPTLPLTSASGKPTAPPVAEPTVSHEVSYYPETGLWAAIRWEDWGRDDEGYPDLDMDLLGCYATRILAEDACRADGARRISVVGEDRPSDHHSDDPTPVEALTDGTDWGEPNEVDEAGEVRRGRPVEPEADWAEGELAEARQGSGHGFGPEFEQESEGGR